MAAVDIGGDNNRVEVAGSVTTAASFVDLGGYSPLPNAVKMSGSGNVLDISGTVSTGGTDVPTVVLSGISSTMTLSGKVLAASGTETAILFANGSSSSPSSLELQQHYEITGLVIGDAGASVTTNLILGGSGSETFDVAEIGDAAKFRNFDRFFKTGTSTWTLTGANDGLNPARRWEVDAGTLLVDASLRETLFGVSSGATLGGTGTVEGVAVNGGGTLAPGGVGSIGTLTATSALVLGPSSIVHFNLGVAGTIGGTENDLIVVEGDLTLDGARINIANAGGFGNGDYTLIQYDRLFLLYGASLGDTPDPDLVYALDTGTGTNSAVVLTVSGGAAGDIQYWDGPSLATGVEGGNGVWNAANTNWTNVDGTANAVWSGEVASFKGAAGTVTVEGAQAFTGMQFQTSGYVIEAGTGGELATSLAATNIRIGAGMVAHITAPITGTGGIVKQEAGTLILSGANTYAGATLVNGGTLRAGGGDAFSAASAHTVAAGAVLDLNDYDQTIGSLAGGGNVTLGTATLTIQGKSLSTTTFGGRIEGSGGLTLGGANTRLILTGENTYTGLTTITNGFLGLYDGSSVAGDIHNDGALAIRHDHPFTYAGVLSGTGQTDVMGTGTTTLTGDSGGYAGRVDVVNGTLEIAAGAVLGTSRLTVDSDDAPASGTLSGLGRIVGDVRVGFVGPGILAPGGDTLGTLTVDGHVSFTGQVSGTGTSTFAVRIAADGTNDALAATSAELGGSVVVTAIDAHTSYVDGQDYTILTTTDANGVTGTFAGATMLTHSAFLTPTLTHNADNVMLTIAVTQDFGTVAETFNQLQAAGALNDLEQTGDALAAFNAIANMDEDNARRAFDLVSGEVHAAGQHVIDQTFALFNRTLRHQGVAGIGAGNVGAETFSVPLGYGPAIAAASAGIVAIDDATTYADARLHGAWAAPLGGFGHVDADGNAGQLDWWNAGLAGGYEGVIDVASGHAVGGFGFGYLRSRGTVDDRLSTFDADGFYLGAYGAWTDGGWNLAGSLSYGANRVSTERNIAFMGTTAQASYWTHTIGLSGEASYAFDLADTTRLAPLFTLDAGWSGHGGFTETGAGALNLTSGAQSWSRLDIGLGLALTHTILTDSGTVTLEGRAVWEHALADVVPSQNLALAGSPTSFTVLGPDAGRDRLRIGAGLSWDVSDDMTLRARYDSLFSNDQANHAASLGLNIRF